MYAIGPLTNWPQLIIVKACSAKTIGFDTQPNQTAQTHIVLVFVSGVIVAGPAAAAVQMPFSRILTCLNLAHRVRRFAHTEPTHTNDGESCWLIGKHIECHSATGVCVCLRQGFWRPRSKPYTRRFAQHNEKEKNNECNAE